MSDIRPPANFPPTNPVERPSQHQKNFFPYEAFSFDDPNVTNPPTLALKVPWKLSVGGATISSFVVTLIDDPDAATVRATLGLASVLAPLPTSSAGLGQWVPGNPGSGNAWVLGAGGTWAYFGLLFVAATGVTTGGIVASVGAGGSTAGSASAGNTWKGFAYQITASDPRDIDFSRPIYVRHGMMQDEKDGPDTYVVTLNGRPYHAIPGHATFDAVVAYLASHLEVTPLEEPTPTLSKLDPEVQLYAEIMSDLVEQAKKSPKWLARLKTLKESS